MAAAIGSTLKPQVTASFVDSSASLSPSLLGTDGFSVASYRRPCPPGWATPYHSRRSASTAVRCSGGDQMGDPPFTSIQDLEALTVLRLKSELQVRGLTQKGKKADLVQRLASAPGVLQQPPPGEKSDEAAVGGHEGTATAPPLPPKTPRKVPKRRKKTGSMPSVAPQDVLGIARGQQSFSSAFSSPIGAAVVNEVIMDAELATNPIDGQMASLDEEEDVEDLDVDEDDYSSSSEFGEETHDSTKKRRVPKGFHRINQPVLPQLPPPTDDMKRNQVIMDLLERRETNFDLEDTLSGGLWQQSDVYMVCTKKALRPWDGPHADRAETHVVVLLSDVFGWEDSFTRNAADQVADVCDAIVLVPDMFRKRPWDNDKPEEEYETWRASHDPDIIAADIRACVAHARAEYKPTSLGLMGFCYGGGRALEEAAAGVVKPDNVVVFYPTRYDLKRIVSKVACPVAAFFAEHDILAGATVEDARLLREGLMNNDKVPDAQVKLCPGADHGFAHRTMTKDKENAEDAMLLATSWLEMYLQKHFRPPRKGVKEESFDFWELPASDDVL